jgi:hypothetical protein
MIYTFAFFYLVYEPRPEGWDVEKDGAGILMGCSYFSPWFNMPSVGPEWIHPGSGRSYKCGLPYPLFLPLGKPADEVKPKNFEALLYQDTELLSRKYENGLVILNPTSAKGKWKFKGNDAEISDPGQGDGFENPKNYNFELDQKYIDVETGDYVEGIITLPPRSGKILLIKPKLTGLGEAESNQAHTYSLNQNYPNPFNPVTEINYALPEDAHVQLGVYDVLGRKVRMLVDRRQSQGINHSVQWTGQNHLGQKTAAGVYLYQMHASGSSGEFSDTKKMLLLR